ncbi:hypothetical protein J4444_03045 [Candidatus Woesearchaeota archaeon]|nr:hypothetical protein [Candidatus Woesearchaeota archaeon]
MPKCSFCGEQIERGTGKMFVYVSGKIDYFCTNKCEKNLFKLKHKPLQTKWTAKYREEHARMGSSGNSDAKIAKNVQAVPEA